jgi:hypothetical protein
MSFVKIVAGEAAIFLRAKLKICPIFSFFLSDLDKIQCRESSSSATEQS